MIKRSWHSVSRVLSRASRLLNYIYRVGRSERSAERSRLDRHGPSLFLSLSEEKSCLIFTGEKIRWYAARANINEQTFPSSQGRCDHCPSAGALLAHPIDNSLPVDRVLQLGGSHPESRTSRSSWEITRNSSHRYSPVPYLDSLCYTRVPVTKGPEYHRPSRARSSFE